jgi:uncharacterized membrane protein
MASNNKKIKQSRQDNVLSADYDLKSNLNKIKQSDRSYNSDLTSYSVAENNKDSQSKLNAYSISNSDSYDSTSHFIMMNHTFTQRIDQLKDEINKTKNACSNDIKEIQKELQNSLDSKFNWTWSISSFIIGVFILGAISLIYTLSYSKVLTDIDSNKELLNKCNVEINKIKIMIEPRK